jgi:hypothetical protein
MEDRGALSQSLTNVSFSYRNGTTNVPHLTPSSTTIHGLEHLPQVSETPLAESQILTKFRSRRFSRFTFFFISNVVDIPTCFRGVSSLLRRKSSALSMYFITSSLRHGNYERFLSKMSRATFSLSTRPNNFQTLGGLFTTEGGIYTRLFIISPNTPAKKDLPFPSLIVENEEGKKGGS